MSNILAKKFTFGSLLKFALPNIIMMIFFSMYTMVDGVFVSRLIGTNALSAVNIVYPIANVVLAVGIMLATGGGAVIAKKMGEGRNSEARSNLSLIVCVGVALGIIMMILGLVFVNPLLHFLGASEALYGYCYDYAVMLLLFTVPAILQMLFQTFFVTAGKPGIGLMMTILGGAANIVLDYVFIGPMGMGIAGAALATGIGYCIPGVFGLFYFLFMRKGVLHFGKPRFDGGVILKSCSNGSSEMVSNLAAAITTILMNLIMMRYLGEDGVAAISVILYAQFLLMALYLGYSGGVAPVVAYNYGDKNTDQLKKLLGISLKFIVICSIATFLVSLLAANSIVSVFSPPGTNVHELAVHGFMLFSPAYLFMGVNVFASAFFTALSNGKVSAIISFLRTFAFLVGMLLLLPEIMGAEGVWLAVPLAEAGALIVSILYLRNMRGVYGYA